MGICAECALRLCSLAFGLNVPPFLALETLLNWWGAGLGRVSDSVNLYGVGSSLFISVFNEDVVFWYFVIGGVWVAVVTDLEYCWVIVNGISVVLVDPVEV